ncbi:MAG: FUSC family protein [Saprospiraceae bacterium]
MTIEELSDLTDEELLAEAKKLRKNTITDAFLIGFMAAVVVYSLVKNTWGMLTLIPLYFIYQLSKKSTRKEDIEKLLKDRGLVQ